MLRLTHRVLQLAEYFGQRYGLTTRVYVALVSTIYQLFGRVVGVCLAGDVLLRWVEVVSPRVVAAILIAVFGGMISLTGMRGLLRAQAVQGSMVLLGGAAAAYMSNDAIGGWSRLVEAASHSSEAAKAGVSAAFVQLSGGSAEESNTWASFLAGGPVILIWFLCMDQQVVQRVLSAQSLGSVRAAAMLLALVCLVLPFCWCLPGLTGRMLFPKELACSVSGCGDADGATYFVLNRLMPTGLYGAMASALLAAVASSAASAIHASASLITLDIARVLNRNEPSDGSLVRTGRIASAACTVLSVFLCLVLPTTSFSGGELLLEITSAVGAPLAVVLLVGMHPRVRPGAGLPAVVVGHFIGATRIVALIALSEEDAAMVTAAGSTYTFAFAEAIVALVVVLCCSLWMKAPVVASALEPYTLSCTECLHGIEESSQFADDVELVDTGSGDDGEVGFGVDVSDVSGLLIEEDDSDGGSETKDIDEGAAGAQPDGAVDADDRSSPQGGKHSKPQFAASPIEKRTIGSSAQRSGAMLSTPESAARQHRMPKSAQTAGSGYSITARIALADALATRGSAGRGLHSTPSNLWRSPYGEAGGMRTTLRATGSADGPSALSHLVFGFIVAFSVIITGLLW